MSEKCATCGKPILPAPHPTPRIRWVHAELADILGCPAVAVEPAP